jgi:hypothetical protein
LEYIVLGSKAYARTEQTAWRQVPPRLVTLPKIQLCPGPTAAGDGTDPQDLAATLDLVANKGVVEPDGQAQVGGRDCDRWVARGRGLVASMSGLRLRLCIDPTTNLPVEMSIDETRWVFSRWNQPQLIEAPAIAAP